MKRCSTCHKEKDLSNFNKHKRGKLGVRSICKPCEKLYKRDFNKKYPWRRVSENIKSRCNNSKYYKHINISLTVDEIKKLWFRDKAYEIVKPSIDRKDNDGNYEYDNCEFIEHVDNVIKGNKEGNVKPILQYNIDNTVVQEFMSIKEASLKMKCTLGNISRALINNSMACGYLWRFKYVD